MERTLRVGGDGPSTANDLSRHTSQSALSGTKGFLLPVVVALRRDSHPLLSFRSLLTVIQWYPLLTCLQNHSLPARSGLPGCLVKSSLGLGGGCEVIAGQAPWGRYEWEGQERTTNNAIQCRHRKPSREEAIRGSIARPVPPKPEEYLHPRSDWTYRVIVKGKDLIVTFLAMGKIGLG
uniref:Uncharacterized protein n=1 Tax=Salix viminalis TaxID=40686 RepID=A0A6N2KVU4_SALVM